MPDMTPKEEMRRLFDLVKDVDLSTPCRLEAFRRWRDEDGSYESLLALHEANMRPPLPDIDEKEKGDKDQLMLF